MWKRVVDNEYASLLDLGVVTATILGKVKMLATVSFRGLQIRVALHAGTAMCSVAFVGWALLAVLAILAALAIPASVVNMHVLQHLETSMSKVTVITSLALIAQYRTNQHMKYFKIHHNARVIPTSMRNTSKSLAIGLRNALDFVLLLNRV